MFHGLSRFLRRVPHERVACLVLLGVLLTGCGSKPDPASEQSREVRVPVALLLEHEIKGDVFGRTIKSPTGVVIDRRGGIFLADTGNDRVIWFNSDFTPLRDIGGRGNVSGLFDEPQYLTVDEDLNLWVSDAGNRRLCQYSDRLEYINETDLRDEEASLRFGRPSGVAVTDFGEVWVCDYVNDQIAVLDNFGRIDRIVGGFGYTGGQVKKPAKVFSDRNDDLYVCDAGNQRIVVYDENGGFIREVTHPAFMEPRGAAFDRHDRLWVLDSRSALIYNYSTTGHFLSTVGPNVAGTDRPIKTPSDLGFTPAGHLVISDTGNNRLLICRILYDDLAPEE